MVATSLLGLLFPSGLVILIGAAAQVSTGVTVPGFQGRRCNCRPPPASASRPSPSGRTTRSRRGTAAGKKRRRPGCALAAVVGGARRAVAAGRIWRRRPRIRIRSLCYFRCTSVVDHERVRGHHGDVKYTSRHYATFRAQPATAHDGRSALVRGTVRCCSFGADVIRPDKWRIPVTGIATNLDTAWRLVGAGPGAGRPPLRTDHVPQAAEVPA